MASPVLVTVRYDSSQRPLEGRGREKRQQVAYFDEKLKRLLEHLQQSVRVKLNEIVSDVLVTDTDIVVDLQPYGALTTRSDTLFVEVRFDQESPYRAVSDVLRKRIAFSILTWLGAYSGVGSYLEVSTVFVPMSGVRVQFDGRIACDSWGEAQELPIGSRVSPV